MSLARGDGPCPRTADRTMAGLLDQVIANLFGLFPRGSMLSYDFNMRALLAVILVSLVCGAVGSLVVGNRMAFFSDALAHCAFAGIAVGLLVGLLVGSVAEVFQN